MKTIVRKDNNISLYLFEDSVYVEIGADKTIIGNPATLYIDDCNTENSLLIENVTNPQDWRGWKYFYIDNKWSLNPDWIDPFPQV